MPCALEINSDGGFKQEHVESCSSTSKNIFPMPQYFISTRAVSMTIKLGRMATYLEKLLAIKSCDTLITSCKVSLLFDRVVMRNHVKNENYICTITMPAATKLGRVVTYHEGLPPMKSYDTLVTWTSEIT